MCKFVSDGGPRRKHGTDQRHKLHRTNHDNFINLGKTLEDAIRFQSDPTGQVINLTIKEFCKDTFKEEFKFFSDTKSYQ